MNHCFTIGEITFANIVKAGTGAKVHKNRKSHGLAIFPGGERTFYFEHKKIKVEGNIWTATSKEKIEKGSKAKVLKIDGVKLIVEKIKEEIE